MWIERLLTMCVRIRVHVMMMKPAVSWGQANMAAAHILRYCNACFFVSEALAILPIF